jgi:hypothetical protein
MNLGQLIESELQAMQKRPARVLPLPAPDVPVGGIIERMVAAALPQTIRDHAAREKAIAQQAKQQETDDRRQALATGFDGEFQYEQGDPNF